MIAANLPAFARQGTRIDITVSALGDADSLLGGTLLVTPLMGADGQVYAVAQGNLAVGGFQVQGDAQTVVKGVPTSGRIPNGAIIEREVPFELAQLDTMQISLRNPDFTTARRISQAINLGTGIARALDPGTVQLQLPANGRTDVVSLLTEIEQLQVETDTAARVVLGKIGPDHAARVLAVLPEETAMETINRMLTMEGVRKEILQTVENTLRSEFMSNLARTSRRDPHESMADIFNNFDRATEKKFLESLEEANRDSAERIKGLMFTFEDLNKLDPASIQVLLRTVEKDKLGLALKGASEDLRDLFFSNMSERAGKIMREDMESLGPVRLRDVDEAQGTMVTVAKDLSDRGEIIIADSKGEDELIY